MRAQDRHYDLLPDYEKDRRRQAFCESVGLAVPAPGSLVYQSVVTPGSSASQQKQEDRLSQVSGIIDKVPGAVREAMLMPSPSANRGKTTSRRPARLPALPTSTPKRHSRSQPSTARQEYFPDSSPHKRRGSSPAPDSERGSPVKRSRHGSGKTSSHKHHSHRKDATRHKHRSRKPSPESFSESTESSTSEDTRRRRKARRKARKYDEELKEARRGKKRRESSDDEQMDELAESVVNASLLE